jgi:hypothetical protein
MPIYLPEHQVGFDANLVGYPTLGSCMAVALLTTRGIYGFHYTPAPIAQVTEFANYITGNMQPGEAARRLYGSCYWPKRYNGNRKAQWQTEMRNIAAALNYTGRVTGFDTSSTSHTDPDDTTYLEYRKRGNKCGIYYKRTQKISLYKPKNVALPGVERIAPDRLVYGRYQRINPTEQKNIYGAMVGPNSKSGEMHEAGFIGKQSFEIT